MELFEQAENSFDQPLAHRMRPRTIDEFVGQDHIVGKGRLLRRVIQADRVSSLIFYGPPGTGKTTLARIIANTTRSHFITINAVLSGVKDLRAAVEEAKEHRDLHDRRTLLFIDEVHRWNRAQQDALLPWVENGTVILIGATTQNPFFEVNSALVSRSRVFQLTSLTQEDLLQVARSALHDPSRGYGSYRVQFDDDALEHLVEVANGDARTLLNAIELAVETTPDSFPPENDEQIHVTREIAEESIQRKVVLYDKEGDYHFDTISAFIKSIRGSDPDAVLYWMARMIYAGEEPHYLFRRMLISASEDVGLADPAALGIVEAAAAAFDRVGMPEGQFFLSQAALYLATTGKSNTTLAFFDAAKAVEEEQTAEVPNHLRDANRDGEGLGHGAGYLYPHAYRDHWVVQHYLPATLQGSFFYEPGSVGYEGDVRNEVLRRREAQLAAADEAPSQEILTFTPPDRQRDRWFSRLVEQRGVTLETARSEVLSRAGIRRHHRILDLRADHGLLIWEALREAPEGEVTALLGGAAERTRSLVESLPATERPVLIEADSGIAPALAAVSDGYFETIIGYRALLFQPAEGIFAHLRRVLSPDGRLVLAEMVPRLGQHLANLLASVPDSDPQLIDRLSQAETAARSELDIPAYRLDPDRIRKAALEAGLAVEEVTTVACSEERLLSAGDIEHWLSLDDPVSTYAAALLAHMSRADMIELKNSLLSLAAAGDPVPWIRVLAVLSARVPG